MAEGGEEGAGILLAVVVDAPEFRGAEEADGFGEFVHLRASRQTKPGLAGGPVPVKCLGWGLGLGFAGFADAELVGNGEFPAATCAAAGQYVAAILGFHAFAEAVDFGAFAVIGLECSFRHGCTGSARSTGIV